MYFLLLWNMSFKLRKRKNLFLIDLNWILYYNNNLINIKVLELRIVFCCDSIDYVFFVLLELVCGRNVEEYEVVLKKI